MRKGLGQSPGIHPSNTCCYRWTEGSHEPNEEFRSYRLQELRARVLTYYNLSTRQL